MIEINECPICESKVFIKLMTCLDYAISHESFSLVKCSNCNFLATSPLPSASEIGRYYESPAYTSHAGNARNAIDAVYFAARNFTLRWKLKLINASSLSPTNRKLLDVGCGVGEFLKVANSHGWQTFGTEPSLEARKHADPTISQNIQPSLSEIQDGGQKFNAITLWHVLEHIHNLNTTLQDLRNKLSENGRMFIAVPNQGSWDGQHYNKFWAAYDVPRHIWHFRKDTMTALLTKNGLKVTQIIPMRLDAFYVSLLSEKYKNNGNLTLAGIVKAVVNGSRSNNKAKKTSEYSSLIYVAKHDNR